MSIVIDRTVTFADRASALLGRAEGIRLVVHGLNVLPAAELLRQGIPTICVVAPDAPAVFWQEGVRPRWHAPLRPGCALRWAGHGDGHHAFHLHINPSQVI